MTTKPFGYSYLLDCYNCCPLAMDDMELHYRTVEELVFRLKMNKMGPPVLLHAPCVYEGDGYISCDGNIEYYRRELYPEKAGVTAFQPLIESSLVIHSCVPTKFSSIDVYSCNDFRDLIPSIRDFLRSRFKFTSYEENLVTRGTKYGEIK